MNAPSSVDLDPALLCERFVAVRRFTERLCAPLSPEDHVVQSMPDASPAAWHLGHTTWFFETLVAAAAIEGYRVFDEQYAYLYNSYYNALGERHPRARRGMLTRPSVATLRDYRRHVDEAVTAWLGSDVAHPPESLRALEIGLHHEQQHQELLLTDVKHLLAQNPLRPAYRDDLAAPRADAPPSLSFVEGRAGEVPTGHGGAAFAYDNETPRHTAWLSPHALGSRLVTCAEYLEFMRDGGYGTPSLWLSDGLDAVQREGWAGPQYWFERDGVWFEHTLGGVRPVDPHAPVTHVSYYEAEAYAAWAGARLPTEFEWEAAAVTADPIHGHFVEDDVLHPQSPAGEGTMLQLLGDGWEWTQSAYAAYPGFRPFDGALAEYNGKFMCGQFVLRGGSVATSRSHIRTTYRNFFGPAARWQFTAIRLAKDV